MLGWVGVLKHVYADSLEEKYIKKKIKRQDMLQWISWFSEDAFTNSTQLIGYDMMK